MCYFGQYVWVYVVTVIIIIIIIIIIWSRERKSWENCSRFHTVRFQKTTKSLYKRSFWGTMKLRHYYVSSLQSSSYSSMGQKKEKKTERKPFDLCTISARTWRHLLLCNNKLIINKRLPQIVQTALRISEKWQISKVVCIF